MNTRALGLAIDRDADVPIGVQLAWGLRARIEDGSVRTGERLPGLREVAESTGLNINTVRAVYQRLDQEGLIESRQGSGTFVADVAHAPAGARAIAANAAREARETGIDPRAVAAALYVGHDRARKLLGEDTARRRELRVQIAVLERAIGELEAEHPGVAPVPARGRRDPGPSLLGAAELEEVRAVLVRRLASVQEAIDAQLKDTAQGVAPARAPQRSRSGSSRSPVKRALTPGASSPARSESKRSAHKRAKTPRPRRKPGPVRPAGAEA